MLTHNIKRTIIGGETVVAITNVRLDFGTWEGTNFLF